MSSNEWFRKELRAGRLTHDGLRQASRRWAASDKRADLAAKRERELVEAAKSALAYLEGCGGLAASIPVGMLRAALAKHKETT